MTEAVSEGRGWTWRPMVRRARVDLEAEGGLGGLGYAERWALSSTRDSTPLLRAHDLMRGAQPKFPTRPMVN